MAVEQFFVSTRDPKKTPFISVKEAKELDKYLELVENIGLVVQSKVQGITDDQAEAIGGLIADRKEVFAKAFKGRPEVLAEEILGYDVES